MKQNELQIYNNTRTVQVWYYFIGHSDNNNRDIHNHMGTRNNMLFIYFVHL